MARTRVRFRPAANQIPSNRHRGSFNGVLVDGVGVDLALLGNFDAGSCSGPRAAPRRSRPHGSGASDATRLEKKNPGFAIVRCKAL